MHSSLTHVTNEGSHLKVSLINSLVVWIRNCLILGHVITHSRAIVSVVNVYNSIIPIFALVRTVSFSLLVQVKLGT